MKNCDLTTPAEKEEEAGGGGGWGAGWGGSCDSYMKGGYLT